VITPAVLVVSTSERIQSLQTLLSSLSQHPYKIYAVLQGYDQIPSGIDEVISLPNPVGAHSARMIGLKKWANLENAWVLLDDDMVATSKTDWITPANLAFNDKSIGFISCNWARTENLAMQKPVTRTYKNQNIVYTGGGMVFNVDTALLILESLPENGDYVCDNTMWSVTAYLHGKINKRYLGSIAIHRIRTKGGRNKWLLSHGAERPDPRYVTVVESNGKKYSHRENKMRSPNDTNLTALAKQTHKQNKQLNYGLL